MTPGQQALSNASEWWATFLGPDDYLAWRKRAQGTRLSPMNWWQRYSLDWFLYGPAVSWSQPDGNALLQTFSPLSNRAIWSHTDQSITWTVRYSTVVLPFPFLIGFSWSVDTAPFVGYGWGDFGEIGDSSVISAPDPSLVRVWARVLRGGYMSGPQYKFDIPVTVVP